MHLVELHRQFAARVTYVSYSLNNPYSQPHSMRDEPCQIQLAALRATYASGMQVATELTAATMRTICIDDLQPAAASYVRDNCENGGDEFSTQHKSAKS